MRRIILAISALGLAVFLCQAALGDVIHLKEGGKLTGQITKETPKKVHIKTKYGPQVIDKDRIEKIDYGETEETYEQRRKKIKRRDAEGHYQLGLWCREKGQDENAKREFRETVRYNPDHRGARKELGYLRYAGKWIPREKAQEYLDRGLVEYDGKLMTPEQKKKLEAEQAVEEEEENEEENKPDASPEEPDEPENAIEEKHVAWSKAKIKKTSHFKVKSNVDSRVLKRYTRLLDHMYKAYRKVLKGKLKENSALDVFIYARRDEYERYEEKSAAGGGIYDVEKKCTVVYHDYKKGDDTTETVLIRETTRQFQDLIFINYYMVPVWLTEGIITYFEVVRIDEKGAAKVGPPPPRDIVTYIRDMTSKRKHIRISKLIRLQRYRFMTESSGEWAKERLYAWSVVYFMLHGPSKYKKAFDKWVDMCASKNTMPEDFEKLIGDIDTFEGAWEKFFNNVKLPPPGTIKGNLFTSEELGVQMTKPGSWSFTSEGLGSGFQIGVNKTKSRADLYVLGNSRKYSTLSFARERERVLRETFNGVKQSDAKLGGKDAQLFVYSEADRRRGTTPGDTKVAYRHYIYAIKDIIYEFILKIEVDKEKTLKEDIEEILNGFTFIKRIKGKKR